MMPLQPPLRIPAASSAPVSPAIGSLRGWTIGSLRGWTIRTAAALWTSAVLSSFAHGQQTGDASYRDDPAMPAGVEGARIASLIATVNAGDVETLEAFLANECTAEFRAMVPMERHLEVFSSLAAEWGAVDFHSVRTYTPPRPGETVVTLKDRNFGAWRAATVWFDETPERRIAGLRFGDARTPTDVTEPELSIEQAVGEIGALVDDLCSRDVFSGAVLVAAGDEVLLTRACGEASKRFHVANRIDTRFNLGSMNKMFTAVAVALLVDRGIVSYDDPIGRWVDESWLPREITDRVTVHHLLSHTSGLGSYFNDTFWNSSRERFRNLSDFKPLVTGDTLAFEPGERFLYSNTGMLLAGVVIESASGRSYFDFVRENVFEPAGMRDTDSYEMDAPVENLAIGYDRAPHSPYGWQNNLFKHVIKGGPAGGGYSTVGDLHRFARALVSGSLLPPDALGVLWTDYSGEGYGYGFGIRDGPAGTAVGHSGGFAGINANLDIFLDRGQVAVVLSNYGGAATPVASRIGHLLARVPPKA